MDSPCRPDANLWAMSWLPTESEWGVLLLSLRVSLVAVAVMLLPGIACAWVLARRRFWGKAVLDVVVHLPLVLPPVVMGFPLLVRAVRLSIEGVEQKIEQAARTLGAGPWRVLWTITLPLAFPGLLAGVMLALARSL